MLPRPLHTIPAAHDHDDDHDDHGGLHRDLLATGRTMDRRRLLRLGARWGLGLGAMQLLGCASDSVAGPDTTGTTTTPSTGTTATPTAGGSCSRIPEETAGPYPGDGSNGANVLNQTGVARSDMRSSFAGLSGTAAGVPLLIELTLVSATTCEPLADRAVYLWHCDRAGLYSLYSAGVTNQNYLRGVQKADAEGKVRFTSIFPGCYAGRWPHIHFEVFASLAAATDVRNKVATSQIALPKATSDLVYATSGYEASVRNLAGITLATDNVFRDGSALELATVTGSVAQGFTAALTVGVLGA
ncbi:intradiol ring-cleavage dioxygenase [Roseisolibacter sp. H3M3-2]|uniref:intradiol ring-cleavage dioxygenase n=1 Tax=Roseisolibacter sp. H3M3-2 TaxID=3031323 RepID=UPI0023DBA2CA|nr:intradiol ring-cleavage dioxygenase [Roseisolibacter sp. H3M3-2]MDF1504763.1 intradiol ring-cleavage dioxygenase [Roseisolibacter sp. H3M3-2]